MNQDHQWPRALPSVETASVGVTKTQLFFQNTAKWAFREQSVDDYGIDAHVEIVEKGNVKGRLVALQIKSGDSWLSPASGGGWHFYPKPQHVNYWQNHSLPVAIVIWQKSTDTLFFKEASRHTFERTSAGGWRLHFTEDDLLNESAIPSLARLSDGSTYDLRLRQLGLLLPWMERIARGERLILKAEEWVNKTWGKGNLEFLSVSQDGSVQLLGRWGVALGGQPYEKALPPLFEWATLVTNPDVEWETEEEFLERPYDASLHPYRNAAGEVDFWSIELHLNEIGRSFLLLDEYARQSPNVQLLPL